MDSRLDPEVLQDELAVSLARVIAAANRRARELGIDVSQALITISQSVTDSSSWLVNYGPKDYLSQRGGDLIVEVNAADASIQRVLRGQ